MAFVIEVDSVKGLGADRVELDRPLERLRATRRLCNPLCHRYATAMPPRCHRDAAGYRHFEAVPY